MRQPQAKCAKIKSECEKSQIPAKSLNPTDLCIFTLHFLFHGHCMWAVTDLLGAPFFHTYVFFRLWICGLGPGLSRMESGLRGVGVWRLCDFYSLPTAPQGVTALCSTRISICPCPKLEWWALGWFTIHQLLYLSIKWIMHLLIQGQ